MKWFTKVEVESSPQRFSYGQKLLCLGSCFAQYFGRQLQRDRFDIFINPFGILYNPHSLHNELRFFLRRKLNSPAAIENSGIWNSFHAHGSIYGLSEVELEMKLEEIVKMGQIRLREASRMVITFGSANVWRLKEDGVIVANCHKLPGKMFSRDRLKVEEILSEWIPLIRDIHSLNPGIQIDFTVSPVRHLRDGLVENMRSKAVLHLAVDQLVREYDFAHYFPSYEILTDELRDYRWYARDMAHPTEEALEYIIESYMESRADPAALELRKQVRKLVAKMEHRHLHPDSESARRFREDLRAEMDDFGKKHPEVKLTVK